MRMTALILAILILPLPARGHNQTEQAEWIAAWTSNALQDRYLSIGEVAELIEFKVKHRPPIRLPAQASPRTPTTWTGTVDQWEPLLSLYFLPADLEWARRVMWCESRGDPNAYNTSSGASGLFQHLERFWADRSAKAGIPSAGIFDPEANIAVASWLFYTGGAQHWVCR